MAIFVYKAKKGPTRTVEGELKAVSRLQAVAELEARGLSPIVIAEQPEGGRRGRREGWRRAGPRDVVVFSYQLASLVRSGVPILRALATIRDQTENRRMRGVVQALEAAVHDGGMLSDALAAWPRLFPPLYMSVVRAGEGGGRLDTALQRLAEAMDREEEWRRKVQAALAYPGLTLGVGVLTVLVLLMYFLPRVSALFAAYEDLPLATRLLIGLSEGLAARWYWLAAAAVLGWAVWRRLVSTERGRLAMDAVKLHIPGLSRFLLLADLSRFARTLAMLLEGGLAIDRALGLSIATIGNRALRGEMEGVRRGTVQEGARLSDGLRRAPHMPAFLTNMCAVGEEAGRLEAALEEVSRFYERQLDRQSRLVISLLEPALILVVGAMVGFIVAAMLLPIFQISAGAR